MLEMTMDREAETLTARELQVLAFAARGLQDKAIARVLGISEETVGDHWRGLLRRLGALNRTHALFLALDAGYCLDLGPCQPTTRTCDCT